MKTLYKYLVVLFGLLSVVSCSEEEVEMFSSELGINFQTNFESPVINFYPLYLEAGMDIEKKDVKAFVQLEGALSNQATHVLLTTQPYEDYEEPEIMLPGDSIIEAGDYARSITFSCMKPKEYDKVYKARLTFDYEKSGVVPGILEEQSRVVTVSDRTIWEDMGVENEEQWNKNYASVLGKYGNVKVRFIMAALGEMGYNYMALQRTYQNTIWYPSFGFQSMMKDLNRSLDEYNAAHGGSLCEADGTPVSFN